MGGGPDRSATGTGSLFNYFYFEMDRTQRWTHLGRMLYPLALTQSGLWGEDKEGHHRVCHRALREISTRRKLCENTRVVHVLGLWAGPREIKSLKAGGFP